MSVDENAVRGNISMEMLKIEQVIVGDHKPPSSAERIEPVVVPIKPFHNESLQCFECFITFSEPKAKERHIKKHHRDQYAQQLQETNTRFTCFNCAKYFHCPDELIRHQVTHNREKTPFPCTRCKQKFCTFTELSQHKRHKCPKRRFPRKDCSALFPTGSRLTRHRIAVHRDQEASEDINTFQCSKCDGGFQTEEDLLQHQEMFASDQNCGLKSQGEKGVPKAKCAAKEEKAIGSRKKSSSFELNIPCPKPDCDCTFPSVEALRAHKQDKHGAPSHKAPSSEYSCPTCGKCFARERALKLHQAFHTKGQKVLNKR
ncbi:zinc finger protein 345 [Nematolebias whitei]|uniref:zinc finger protein 345 n=1 Tax=Nematolebias whitei TaxID=451745 RepID=UPI00189AE60A|nr:zinc finger protein 345 [Nematolebias whitei]